MQENKDSVAKIRSSLLNLVDLAGSERQRDTRTAGLRLKVLLCVTDSVASADCVCVCVGSWQHQQVAVSAWKCHHGTSGHRQWQVSARSLPRLKAYFSAAGKPFSYWPSLPPPSLPPSLSPFVSPLLQDSLGGNAKTNLVANVHPSSRFVAVVYTIRGAGSS